MKLSTLKLLTRCVGAAWGVFIVLAGIFYLPVYEMVWMFITSGEVLEILLGLAQAAIFLALLLPTVFAFTHFSLRLAAVLVMVIYCMLGTCVVRYLWTFLPSIAMSFVGAAFAFGLIALERGAALAAIKSLLATNEIPLDD